MTRLLVIEDEPALSQMLQRTLTNAGYQVTLAADGLDALVQIDKSSPKPQLLIVDIMMPELDGLSLVQALRGQRETKNIPVIFLTAKTDSKSIAEGISAGAKYYVTKPFTIDELLTKIKRALGGR